MQRLRGDNVHFKITLVARDFKNFPIFFFIRMKRFTIRAKIRIERKEKL